MLEKGLQENDMIYTLRAVTIGFYIFIHEILWGITDDSSAICSEVKEYTFYKGHYVSHGKFDWFIINACQSH